MNVYYTTPLETIRQPRTGDAGYDVAACEYVSIHPGEKVVVNTGAHIRIPDGYAAIFFDRSGMAGRGLLYVGLLNEQGEYIRAGLIDSSYVGLLRVVIYNAGRDVFQVEPGARITQMVVMPYVTPPLVRVASAADLGVTERGENGFGSTGLKVSA